MYKCSNYLKVNKRHKTKENKNSLMHPMNKKGNLKKIMAWKEPRHRLEFRSFRSNFLFILSINANEVKRYKKNNGIK